MTTALSRREVLDLYFLEARCRLIDVAAFLDRVERAPGGAEGLDFRWEGLRQALRHLAEVEPGRAERVLRTLSDPTLEPIPKAPGKGAVGAWSGQG